jgi:hypothetical protein
MRSSSRTGLQLSDRDMYVAVTVAWYRFFSRAQRRQHPLRPYVFGNEFTRSVAAAEIDAVLVAHACAQIACRHGSQWGRGERLQPELEPREALDPAAAWWRGLDGADGMGVHYVELGGGTLEFLTVARKHNRPNIEGQRR